MRKFQKERMDNNTGPISSERSKVFKPSSADFSQLIDFSRGYYVLLGSFCAVDLFNLEFLVRSTVHHRLVKCCVEIEPRQQLSWLAMDYSGWFQPAGQGRKWLEA